MINYTIDVFNASTQVITEPCIGGLTNYNLIFYLFLILLYIFITKMFFASIRKVELKNFDKDRELIVLILYHVSTLILCLCGVLIYYLVFL